MADNSTRRVQRFRDNLRRQADAAKEASRAEGGAAFEDRFAADPGYFIESCLWVRHIDGGTKVPFQLSSGQETVVEEVRKGLESGEPVRLVVLKSRRSLISSVCEALGYWRTSTASYTEGLILAHKQEVTEEIFSLVDGFYIDDERKHLGLRPETENSNRRELRFGNPNKKDRDTRPGLQSGLRVTSAEAKEAGRAGTYHFVHASEVAYWPSDEVWQSVGIALTRAPGTIAVMESTANGQGGLFHETYLGAKAGPGVNHRKGRGANEFTAIFLPWFDDRKNRVELSLTELSDFDYETAREREYAERYKLSPGQVLWRRRTISSPICFKPGVTRESVFQQEYPANDEEAFLTSGKHFFLMSSVKTLEEDARRGVREPAMRAEIVNDGQPMEERSPRNRFTVKPKLIPEPEGSLQIWCPPGVGRPYLVAVDPAEGLVDGDESVIYVLDRVGLEFVAAWGGTHQSARQLAWTATLIAWLYNNALLAIEHNNHGLATIEEARRVVYPFMWHHKDVSRPDSEPTDRVGWMTTGATRSYALLNLEAEIRSGALAIHDQAFFDQTRTFVFPSMEGKQRALTGGGGAPRARPGAHDDRVMCAAIALAVHMNAATARLPNVKPEMDPKAPLLPDSLLVNPTKIMERRRIKARGAWR